MYCVAWYCSLESVLLPLTSYFDLISCLVTKCVHEQGSVSVWDVCVCVCVCVCVLTSLATLNHEVALIESVGVLASPTNVTLRECFQSLPIAMKCYMFPSTLVHIYYLRIHITYNVCTLPLLYVTLISLHTHTHTHTHTHCFYLLYTDS